MRAGAEVDEGVLTVTGDHVAALLPDQLDLEVVAQALEVGERLPLGLLDPADRDVARLDLPHTRLDPLQILRRERRRPLEVVEEALLGRGADADLHLGEQLLDRVGQEMGRRVTVDFERLRRVRRDEGDRGVAFERQVDVLLGAVHHGRDRHAGQFGVELPGDRLERGAARERAHAAVRKGDVDRFHVSGPHLVDSPRIPWSRRGGVGRGGGRGGRRERI